MLRRNYLVLVKPPSSVKLGMHYDAILVVFSNIVQKGVCVGGGGGGVQRHFEQCSKLQNWYRCASLSLIIIIIKQNSL